MKNRQGAAINDMQEMLRKCPGTGPDSIGDVLEVLQNFSGIRIAIEFKCGESCKTVSNGRFLLPITIGEEVLILLFPDDDEELCLKECSCGKSTKKELEFIVIPYVKISSFDFYENECFAPVRTCADPE